MFQKADPDHMLSSGTTYVRIDGESRTLHIRPAPSSALGHLLLAGEKGMVDARAKREKPG
jgi:hypothetical protein